MFVYCTVSLLITNVVCTALFAHFFILLLLLSLLLLLLFISTHSFVAIDFI